jgi:hypothetical protein
MAEPRSNQEADPTVPEDATEEPQIRGDEEEDERGARREEQQDRSAHPVWPDVDDPLRQGGESAPPPAHRHH